MDNGCLTIQGNASFTLNTAADGEGGAMQLNYTSSNISGNLSLNKNKALGGGAMFLDGASKLILNQSLVTPSSQIMQMIVVVQFTSVILSVR